MPTVNELKSSVFAEIDKRGRDAISMARCVTNIPEPGFREQRTSRLVAEKFRELGIPYQDNIAITGLKGMLDGTSPGPTIGVIGELDSLIVKGHPNADPQTDWAHACGHDCQLGMMLAVAIGFK